MSQEWSPGAARAVLEGVSGPGPVLMALQAVQEAFGHVPSGAVGLVAERFNVSRAEVYGVLTFYSDLRSAPPAAVEVRVCMGEACQAVGARELLAQADAAMASDCDVRHVFCLGNCAVGPTAVVNGTMLGRTSGDAVARAVDAARVTS
jgi:formate dehydrogenase subunit gamma